MGHITMRCVGCQLALPTAKINVDIMLKNVQNDIIVSMFRLKNFYNYRYYFISAILLIVSLGFVQNTLEMMGNTKRLENLRQEVVDLETQQKQVQDRIKYQKTDEYIEEEARNKLNMLKPNEKVYVADKSLEQVLRDEQAFWSKRVNTQDGDTNASNLRLWLNLLF
jgi:cell division protein DivIC